MIRMVDHLSRCIRSVIRVASVLSSRAAYHSLQQRQSGSVLREPATNRRGMGGKRSVTLDRIWRVHLAFGSHWRAGAATQSLSILVGLDRLLSWRCSLV